MAMVSGSESAQCDGSQLCKELAGVRCGITFHELYQGDPESRVIRETSNFALVADISPLTHGHTLLVPKAHYISFARVPKELQEELESFRSCCTELVAGTFGTPTILEHGSSTIMRDSPCISHAHWHFVPNGQDVTRIFDADGLRYVSIPSWRQLSGLAKDDRPYIFYSFGADNRVYVNNLSKRHQYLRIVVAEVLGIPEPEWDWALTLHPERLRATVKALTKDRAA
jgi:diadenosine tetraphosphate (Ap4A) HIT family hydrolase